MNKRTATFRPAALLMGAVFACGTALAAADKPAQSSSYQQERAACLAGQTNQDRATCLKEAGAAHADKKKNPVKFDAAAKDVNANARARCEPLNAEQKAACMARISGQGRVSGSVESGGIYRELVTLEKPDAIVQPSESAADKPPTR